MSRRARDWAYQVLAGRKLPPGAAYLLLVLADIHNPKYGCFPSQAVLCERLHMPERTLRWNLDVLIRAGLLRVRYTRRGGREYLLNLDSNPPEMGQNLPITAAMDCRSHRQSVADLPPEEQGGIGNGLPILLNPVTQSSGESGNLIVSFATHGNSSSPKSPLTGACGEEGKPEVPETTGVSEVAPPPLQPDALENPMKASDIVAKAMQPKSEAEALADFTKKKPVTGATLGRLWLALHALYFPKYTLAELSRKDRKQLLLSHKLCPEEFAPALALAIRDWTAFTAYVRMHKGSKTSPSVPSITYVQAYVQLLVAYRRFMVKVEAAQPVQPDAKLVEEKPLTKSTPVVQHDPLPTPEELDKLFG